MTDNNFDIKILDLHWIKDVDDPTDLCAHGHVFVKIGDEVCSRQRQFRRDSKCNSFVFNADTKGKL